MKWLRWIEAALGAVAAYLAGHHHRFGNHRGGVCGGQLLCNRLGLPVLRNCVEVERMVEVQSAESVPMKNNDMLYSRIHAGKPLR